MKKCKKVLAVLLTLTMTFSLAACGSDNTDTPAADETPTDSTSNETTETPKTEDNTSTSSDTVPENDTLVASVEQGLEGKFSPFFSLSANDTSIMEMTTVYVLESDRVGNPIMNGIEGETRSYNGTD